MDGNRTEIRDMELEVSRKEGMDLEMCHCDVSYLGCPLTVCDDIFGMTDLKQ